ncbi:MAG: hypothetical protein J6A29_00935 [Clostridia bacterium]|nr:hypothetical protein [Clostridia bacterium]
MKREEREAIEILEKYNQHHIVEHMEKLDNNNKAKIMKQIEDINFEEMANLYNKTKTNREKRNSDIKPIKTLIADNIEQAKKREYREAGEEILKEGKLAVVTMAGGQGTRLRA